MCGGHHPMIPGYICTPDGRRSYDPTHSKMCGTTVCNILAECGDNACLSPYRQTAAFREGSPPVSQPTVSVGAADKCRKLASDLGRYPSGMGDAWYAEQSLAPRATRTAPRDERRPPAKDA
jgi:hypothetical protein